jgi:hypothetical protein
VMLNAAKISHTNFRVTVHVDKNVACSSSQIASALPHAINNREAVFFAREINN